MDTETEDAWICSECEEEISETDKFCKNCGEVIERKTKYETKISEEITESVTNKSSGFTPYLKNASLLIVLLLILGFTSGFINGVSSPITNEPEPAPIKPPQLTETQQKVQLVEKIAKNYYDTHTYQDNNVFDCDNMAQDVWDMLKAQGINAKISIGNIDKPSPITLEDVNHAWVMAEIEPDTYIAVETTGGYIVYGETNSNYYSGFSFKDPKNYRSFTELYKNDQFQLADYNNEIDYYNRLVKVYNNANGFEQLGMNSGMQVAKMNLDEKKRRFEETQIKLNALLEYG